MIPTLFDIQYVYSKTGASEYHCSKFNFQIVVNNAPDLRDRNERRRVQSMVHAFANTKYSIGKLIYRIDLKVLKF